MNFATKKDCLMLPCLFFSVLEHALTHAISFHQRVCAKTVLTATLKLVKKYMEFLMKQVQLLYLKIFNKSSSYIPLIYIIISSTISIIIANVQYLMLKYSFFEKTTYLR